MKQFLSGIKILDLSSMLPCPFASHLFAKFGAEVIKVESPNRPDPARKFGFAPKGKDGSCYREINDIKSLVWLDLKNEKDRTKLYEIVKTCDAAIEGYRPEVKKRLGIDYETLHSYNPKLVYVSASGFDVDGPNANRASHDIGLVARSGILDQTRDNLGNCVMPGLPVGDYVIAYAAAFRMAVGILHARAHGKGSHIEISIEEALNEVQRPFLRELEESREFPEKAGAGNKGRTLVTGKFPCYRLYNLQDGALSVGALEEKFWEIFCHTIGCPDLIPNRFSVGDEGNQTIMKVQTALSRKSFPEWREIFSKLDCCVEPVLTLKEVIDGI